MDYIVDGDTEKYSGILRSKGCVYDHKNKRWIVKNIHKSMAVYKDLINFGFDLKSTLDVNRILNMQNQFKRAVGKDGVQRCDRT